MLASYPARCPSPHRMILPLQFSVLPACVTWLHMSLAKTVQCGNAALLFFPSPLSAPKQFPYLCSGLISKITFFYEVLETDRAELAAPPLCASITSTLFIQQLFMQLLLCANPMKQTYVVFVLLEHTMRETNIKSSHTDERLQTEISVMKPLHVPKKKKKKGLLWT